MPLEENPNSVKFPNNGESSLEAHQGEEYPSLKKSFRIEFYFKIKKRERERR